MRPAKDNDNSAEGTNAGTTERMTDERRRIRVNAATKTTRGEAKDFITEVLEKRFNSPDQMRLPVQSAVALTFDDGSVWLVASQSVTSCEEILAVACSNRC